MFCHRGDNFVIEYLSEIETELENSLAFLSGAQMGLNHEKNGGRNLTHTPCTCFSVDVFRS